MLLFSSFETQILHGMIAAPVKFIRCGCVGRMLEGWPPAHWTVCHIPLLQLAPATMWREYQVSLWTSHQVENKKWQFARSFRLVLCHKIATSNLELLEDFFLTFEEFESYILDFAIPIKDLCGEKLRQSLLQLCVWQFYCCPSEWSTIVAIYSWLSDPSQVFGSEKMSQQVISR